MSSNFDFLKNDIEWARLHSSTAEAERWGKEGPGYSVLLCRKALEEWVRWLYDNDGDLVPPYDNSIHNLLNEPSFRNLVQDPLYRDLNLIRKLGNQAAHERKNFSTTESLSALKMLYRFVTWVYRVYSYGEIKTVPPFDESLVPAGRAKELRSAVLSLQEELSRHKEELRRKDQKIQENEKEKAKLQADLARTAAIKAKNEAAIKDIPAAAISEKVTRELYIDAYLRDAGWNPQAPNTSEYPVTGMPNPSGKGFVDYVLWGNDGLPLALIEAKATSKDAENGAYQARLYADCLEKRFGRRPIIFLSNGFGHYIVDKMYPRRFVAGFYTKDELERLHQRHEQRQDLLSFTPKDSITNRYYQKEALAAISKAFQTDKQRRTLLVMATGSGKTRTATSLVDILQRADWAKKILFLADRIELVKQALTDGFKKHLPNTTVINLAGKFETKEFSIARVFGSTYQTLIGRIDEDKFGKNRLFGPGFFDLIIVDEAHRSVYNKYGQLFRYFDALYVGLTATPRGEIDQSTYEVFETPKGDPTYAYELQQAIDDGFLVPYRVLEVPLQIPTDGIKYDNLSEEEKRRYEDDFGDPVTGDLPDEVEGSSINNWVFNQDTVDKVITQLIEHGIKIESGDQLGKSIIFARNHKHAIYIEERFKKLYPNLPDAYIQVIDNQNSYASDAIDKFKRASNFPQIAVSVDMLDTGIDVPELVNLVFFKPVRSSVKFWQMIGRGTRLCLDLFGPKQDKTCFYIFDFCRNFEYFDIKPEGQEANPQQSMSSLIFWLRYCISEALKDSSNETEITLHKMYLDQCHQDTCALKDDSFEVRLQLEHVAYFRKKSNWDDPSEAEKRIIKKNIASIMRYEGHVTERQFDLLMLNTIYAHILQQKGLSSYIGRVQSLAKSLTKKGGVPAVAAKMPFIQNLLKEETWTAADAPFMEQVRIELRELIRFIDKKKLIPVYTNIEDSILSSTWREPSEETSYDLEQYRNRMKAWIKEHKTNLTIHKIHNNEPITGEELEKLSQLLFEETNTQKDKAQQVLDGKNLALFIRSTIGLDKAATLKAFSEFMDSTQLSTQQSSFIHDLINHLEHNGLVEIGNLFEAPYNRFHSNGVGGVFDQKQVGRIVSILNGFKQNLEVG